MTKLSLILWSLAMILLGVNVADSWNHPASVAHTEYIKIPVYHRLPHEARFNVQRLAEAITMSALKYRGKR